MEFIAQFKKLDGHLLRFDTRIYLDSFNPDAESECVGAIIGKNPGSAVPVELDRLMPLALNGDKMLPTVGNRFVEGYALARKAIPSNAYVRVWNLFYVCSKDLGEAIEIASTLNPLPVCPSERESVPVAWFGWGGNDEPLNKFKERFLRRKFRNVFYYDHHSGHVVDQIPSASAFAKHTQGMPAAPVAAHLAQIL
ncbi:hypothetical protein ACR2R6_07000 [Methylocaldum gracile subsp. desertum]|jgi:hypothetical protein|uniref:hypothetical protein n=1 Tax=Methylocaldum sp. GT1BW TaxID=3438964 RepID=UPI003DA09C59